MASVTDVYMVAGRKPDGTISILSLSAGGELSIASNAAGENHIGEVGGRLRRVSAEFTRPADTTAYTAGDVVSDNATTTTPLEIQNAARVTAGSGYIVKCRVVTDKKSITPRMRVHVYNAVDPTVSADNAPHKELYADTVKHAATIDLPVMTTPVDTTNSTLSRASDATIRQPFVCATGTSSLWVVLEAIDAFTPASGQKFTVVFWIDQN